MMTSPAPPPAVRFSGSTSFKSTTHTDVDATLASIQRQVPGNVVYPNLSYLLLPLAYVVHVTVFINSVAIPL